MRTNAKVSVHSIDTAPDRWKGMPAKYSVYAVAVPSFVLKGCTLKGMLCDRTNIY